MSNVLYLGDDAYNVSKQVITASSPLIFTDDEGNSAVAAAVGLQMRYDKFYELFMNR